MNVSTPLGIAPRLFDYVRRKADAGLYGSSSEVKRDAFA